MESSQKTKSRKKPVKRKAVVTVETETEPGAWERFEHAVDAAVKSGPKHRTAPKPHKPPAKRRKPKKL